MQPACLFFRRHQKTIKREVQAAARQAVQEALGSVSLNPSEVAELTRAAMAETYQRLRLRKEPRDPSVRSLSRCVRGDGDGDGARKLTSQCTSCVSVMLVSSVMCHVSVCFHVYGLDPLYTSFERFRECDEGNVEYKLKLKDPESGNPYRLHQLVRACRAFQMNDITG